jgi:hypothetical protein
LLLSPHGTYASILVRAHGGGDVTIVPFNKFVTNESVAELNNRQMTLQFVGAFVGTFVGAFVGTLVGD